MTQFISHLHEDLRGTRRTKRGSTHRAEDVPTGLHKSYPRFETIPLPKPAHIPDKLADVLGKRLSYHGGTDSSEMSLEQCGTLFGLALGKRDQTTHRNYPSGGALYPIETYLISSGIPGHAPSVFHYNPTLHALEKLWKVPNDLDFKNIVRHPPDLLFSSLIVFTSVWKRSSAKYGDFTYTVAMLEAGHMSENAILVATALGLQARPMAGFNDEAILSLLDIDREYEQPVHTITLC